MKKTIIAIGTLVAVAIVTVTSLIVTRSKVSADSILFQNAKLERTDSDEYYDIYQDEDGNIYYFAKDTEILRVIHGSGDLDVSVEYSQQEVMEKAEKYIAEHFDVLEWDGVTVEYSFDEQNELTCSVIEKVNGYEITLLTLFYDGYGNFLAAAANMDAYLSADEALEELSDDKALEIALTYVKCNLKNLEEEYGEGSFDFALNEKTEVSFKENSYGGNLYKDVVITNSESLYGESCLVEINLKTLQIERCDLSK